MAVRVGINGFGRIGRLVCREMLNHPARFDVCAINDLSDPADLANLLKYDSVHGPFAHRVTVVGNDELDITNGHGANEVTRRVKVFRLSNPKELPWEEHGVEVVLESTGKLTRRESENGGGYGDHLRNDRMRVVLSAPAKDDKAFTVVFGVNEHQLRKHHICVSNGSCTTNCLAPIVKVLHENFGIEEGLLTTVHAYTNDQRVHDGVHQNPRRARAAALNIVPTTTGAARAVGKVIPELDGKLNGQAVRVPVPNGSLVDLVVILGRKVTRQQVNDALRIAAERMPTIISYCEDPIVSSDIIGDSHSAIVDAEMTMTMPKDGGRMVKVFAWYDNEWAYSVRTADLIEVVGGLAMQ